MHQFQYGTTTIEYTLNYNSSKEDVCISVDWIDGVTVNAPVDLTIDSINEILYRKAPWILKKWFAFEEIASTPPPKEYISGEKFKYINRAYKLKVIVSTDVQTINLQFNQGKFLATVPSHLQTEERRTKLRNLFQQWYINAGQTKINERAKLYANKLGVTPSKVVVKDQKMRWGTCTNNHSIYINWRVMLAPMKIIDYVIVHELAHIKINDHSAEYWQLVRSILPDYEERKEWLRVNGPLLTLE